MDGKRQGEWVLRHANGNKEKGVYKDDKEEGIWLKYDVDDRKCWSVAYKNGFSDRPKKLKKKICQQTAW